jgi:hypothetical protein
LSEDVLRRSFIVIPIIVIVAIVVIKYIIRGINIARNITSVVVAAEHIITGSV